MSLSSYAQISGSRNKRLTGIRRCLPGENDSDEELDALTQWVGRELRPDVPLHFTAFHPDYRMLETAPTPAPTLQKARAIAIRNGLHHVYVGNVHDPARQATLCPTCGARAI